MIVTGSSATEVAIPPAPPTAPVSIAAATGPRRPRSGIRSPAPAMPCAAISARSVAAPICARSPSGSAASRSSTRPPSRFTSAITGPLARR